MSDPGYVRVESADGIGTVRFFHPRKNSLPGALLEQLTAAVDQHSADPDVRVIVLRSDGDGPFCAGASFDEFIAVETAEAAHAFFMGFAGLILAMRRSPKFVIGRVHGKAVGGGVGLACACDYALATHGASVRLSEFALGFGPFIIGPAVERRVGRTAFSALAIDTEWRDPEWAHQHQIYTQLCEDDDALDAALENLTVRLSRSNPEAMAALKQVFWEGTDHWEDLLPRRAELTATLVLSEYTRSALRAFKEGKR